MVAIVRKDKILSGYNGNLESVVVTPDAEITNGVFVTVGKLVEGQRELKEAKLADVEDIAKEVYLIHNPEVMADERLHKLEDFRIKAGKAARAYSLSNGDIITLTEGLLVDEVAVGDILAVKADGKLGKLAEDADAKIKFVVIENAHNELHHTANAWAVQVER